MAERAPKTDTNLSPHHLGGVVVGEIIASHDEPITEPADDTVPTVYIPTPRSERLQREYSQNRDNPRPNFDRYL